MRVATTQPMIYSTTNSCWRNLRHVTVAVLTATCSLQAQDVPSDPIASWIETQVPAGKLILNTRLRHETADQEGLSLDSRAVTLRTRLGYQTASYAGFQALVEGEWVEALNDSEKFNAAGRHRDARNRPIIADPEASELNRLWVSYTSPDGIQLKLGRQVLALDDHRFIGHVGWRQNQQTFDALTLTGKLGSDVSLHYSYVDKVHRIFGDHWPDRAGPIGQFNSDSHLFNLRWNNTALGTLSAFAYLVSLDEAASLSSATYGLRLSGNRAIGSQDHRLDYVLSVATQSDYKANFNEFRVYHVNASATYALPMLQMGVAYELLGSDNGIALQTPLATLHAFNGWADVFLTTPAAGLQDFSLSLSTRIPVGTGLTAKAIYHEFRSHAGSLNYGSEIDLLLSYRFTRSFSTTVKYADFDRDSIIAPASMQRLTLQCEFIY